MTPTPDHLSALHRRYAAAVAEIVAAGIADAQELTQTQLELLPLEPSIQGWRLVVAGRFLTNDTIRFRYNRVVASINPPDIEEGTAAVVYLGGLEEAIITKCPKRPGEHEI